MPAPKKEVPVKLKDIANDVEVSIATVSLALRNDPSITEETRRRVMEAKKRLGYRPIRRRTPPIPASKVPATACKSILYCLMGFPIRKTQYTDFLEGVMSACSQRKIRLEIKSIQPDEILSNADLPLSETDGVILTGEFQKDAVDFFLNANPNTIILGNYPFPHVHRVELDVFGTGEITARRLVEDGHRHIVHLLRFPKNYYERQFLMGLRDGLEMYDIPLPSSHILRIENMAESITDIVDRILKIEPTPTAITSHASNIAEACLTEIRCRQGNRSGTSPIGYAVGLLSNERTRPELHILNMGLERCGWMAVERLCQIRDCPPPFPYASVLHAAGWKDADSALPYD